ncbi:hypothetical protein [Ralstonia sp. SET104]|uniref:hypothetical protein n=1 Tax=Ralstonia sp. SET104 TaxID=2448774 RepID=UPI000F5648B5|nr:hypothetical protein [Ralstonia sp. SET104]
MIKEAEQIEIFPATFKGAVPVDRSRPTESVSSDYHRSQSDAELQLRILCKERHFDFIFERRFTQKKEWDGNYEYKLWRASAMLGHKTDI